jgi:hypothetical protein
MNASDKIYLNCKEYIWKVPPDWSTLEYETSGLTLYTRAFRRFVNKFSADRKYVFWGPGLTHVSELLACHTRLQLRWWNTQLYQPWLVRHAIIEEVEGKSKKFYRRGLYLSCNSWNQLRFSVCPRLRAKRFLPLSFRVRWQHYLNE